MNTTDEAFDSLGAKADAAFLQAAWKVIERAKQTGTPLIVWEDGQVVERSPEEVERRLRQKDDSVGSVQPLADASPPA